MKLKNKIISFVLLSVFAVFLLTGCGGTGNQYESNNSDGYTVSVKFDANGGEFTTSVYSIVDSFNPSLLKVNANGKAEIALIPTDSSLRSDKFTATKNGCFLAGWYATCTESVDENGTTVYSYSDKWNFETDVLEIDPNGEYDSKTPVLTLYAVWAPLFQVRLLDKGTNNVVGSYSFDPSLVPDIKMPAWDEKTGEMNMGKLPAKSGYTFVKAYTDAEGTQEITEAVIKHPGVLNESDGTVTNPVLDLYVDWKEGEWYRISSAEQFIKKANLNGCYEIMADLDFTDKVWPTVFMHGNFGGKIVGNGYSFKNINLTQTNNSKTNAGVFGAITESAAISDLTFDNVSFTIEAGARLSGTTFGILAGSLSESAAISNLKLQNSVLTIDSAWRHLTDDFSVGLVCGRGNDTAVITENLTCAVIGDKVQVTLDGNTVNVEFAQ